MTAAPRDAPSAHGAWPPAPPATPPPAPGASPPAPGASPPARPATPPQRADPAWRELLVAAVGLLALGCAAFGPYVLRGGLYWDDWENAATTAHPPAGFFGPVDLGLLFYRPVLALLLPLPHEVAGGHPALQLSIAAALTVAMVWCFYLALRTAALATRHAAPIAVLALLFPASTATRLWSTGAVNNVAVALYLLGLTAGLRALDAPPARAGRLRAGATALYVLAILTYEAVAFAALASVVVYGLARGWRPALRQWRTEAPFVVAAIAFVALTTTRPVQPAAGALLHVGALATQTVSLMARSLVPVSGVPAGAVIAVLVAAGALSIGLSRRVTPDDPRHRALAQGWRLGAVGLATVAGAYVMFVPSSPEYLPLAGGIGDRVNLVAALGFAIAVYGIALVAGALAAWALRAPAVAAAVTALACAGVALGYVVGLEQRQRQWERAWALQQTVLGPINRDRARLPQGATVYSFGHPLYTAPGVPVFATSWDLNGAIRATTGDPSLSAYPLGRRGRLSCATTGPGPAPTINNLTLPTRYGRAFLLDVGSGRFVRIESRVSCQALNRRIDRAAPRPRRGGSSALATRRRGGGA